MTLDFVSRKDGVIKKLLFVIFQDFGLHPGIFLSLKQVPQYSDNFYKENIYISRINIL